MLALFNAVTKMSLVAGALCLVLFACRRLTWRTFSATWHYGVSLVLVLLLMVWSEGVPKADCFQKWPVLVAVWCAIIIV